MLTGPRCTAAFTTCLSAACQNNQCPLMQGFDDDCHLQSATPAKGKLIYECEVPFEWAVSMGRLSHWLAGLPIGLVDVRHLADT